MVGHVGGIGVRCGGLILRGDLNGWVRYLLYVWANGGLHELVHAIDP
jgi:hypothetical protein